jgi:EpsI family protein
MLAAATAALMMFVFGLGYRALTVRLAAPANTASVSSAALEQIPLQIGAWMGQDIPLDKAIVRATDTDAHLNRRYSRRGGLEAVSLYIAGGVRARDLMPHRPEVCYTGAGWTLVDQRVVELPLNDGTKLPCNIFQFSRGTLGTEKIRVLDYYIVDGQYCHDVSLLRWKMVQSFWQSFVQYCHDFLLGRPKAWRGSGTVGYVAQVQIAASVTANLAGDSTDKAVADFAGESASSIAGAFRNAGEAQGAEKQLVPRDSALGGSHSG